MTRSDHLLKLARAINDPGATVDLWIKRRLATDAGDAAALLETTRAIYADGEQSRSRWDALRGALEAFADDMDYDLMTAGASTQERRLVLSQLGLTLAGFSANLR